MSEYIQYERMTDRNIGSLVDLEYFIRTFEDFSLTEGLFTMVNECPFYRPVLGDGNCFYRAVAFCYLRQSDLSKFSNVFQLIENQCPSEDGHVYKQELKYHLQQAYDKHLKPIKNTKGKARQNALVEIFNNFRDFDIMMIMYLRSLNYQEIIKKKYANYIISQDQINRIKLLNEEAEGTEFHAMAQALNVTIITNAFTKYGFHPIQYKGSQSKLSFDLIFRTHHYEIIYKQGSIYLQGVQSKLKSMTPNQPSPQRPLNHNRSQLHNRSLHQSQIADRNQFRQTQFRRYEIHQQTISHRSYEPNIRHLRPENPRNSYEASIPRNSQRQKKSLQYGIDPFQRENDQRADIYNSYSTNTHQTYGLNNSRDDRPTIKEEKNHFQIKKLPQPPKSRPFQEKQKIKTKSVLNTWEPHEIQAQEKSKVQEIAIILLFFVIMGYVVVKIF